MAKRDERIYIGQRLPPRVEAIPCTWRVKSHGGGEYHMELSTPKGALSTSINERQYAVLDQSGSSEAVAVCLCRGEKVERVIHVKPHYEAGKEPPRPSDAEMDKARNERWHGLMARLAKH